MQLAKQTLAKKDYSTLWENPGSVYFFAQDNTSLDSKFPKSFADDFTNCLAQ